MRNVRYAPDGLRVAGGGGDGLLQVVAGHADLVTAVAWSPDGSRLASTAGGPLVSLATNTLSAGPDMAIRFWRWE